MFEIQHYHATLWPASRSLNSSTPWIAIYEIQCSSNLADPQGDGTMAIVSYIHVFPEMVKVDSGICAIECLALVFRQRPSLPAPAMLFVYLAYLFPLLGIFQDIENVQFSSKLLSH